MARINTSCKAATEQSYLNVGNHPSKGHDGCTLSSRRTNKHNRCIGAEDRKKERIYIKLRENAQGDKGDIISMKDSAFPLQSPIVLHQFIYNTD
jgi:hypothetical protein